MANYRPKLKRLKPGEEGYKEPPIVQPQPRDIRIIDLVYKHRLLSSNQIYALVEGSDQRLKERLHLLWLNGYLERPPDQRVLRVRGDLRHLVYSLGEKGAELLAEKKGHHVQKLNWVQRSQVKYPFILHNLFISQFFVCLKLAVQEKQGVKLSVWKQGKKIEGRISRPDYITARESRANRPLLQPDALFTLYSVRKDTRRFFFLETDRGTVRERTMLGRYKKYWALWNQRRHTNQGIPENVVFRVVTVTKKGKRAENLREMLEKEMEKEQGVDWLGIPGMFWFGQEEWSIDHPEPLLSKEKKCFMAPDKDQRYSLIGDGFT